MNATHYINANMMQRESAKNVIEEFSNELSTVRGRLIDVGSGTGDVTKELLLPRLESDVVVVGSDISEFMVDYANLNYAEDKRLSFIALDIETTKLPSKQHEQYDFVVSFSCLHWCKDIRRTFSNIYKLLRPGGKALIEFMAHHDSFESYHEMRKNPVYEPYMRDVNRYIPYFQYCEDSRADLRKILDETGFKVIHCSKRERTCSYKNRDVLRRHVLAVNPFVSNMPDNMKDTFIDDLMQDIIMTNQIKRPHKKKRQIQHEQEDEEITHANFASLTARRVKQEPGNASDSPSPLKFTEHSHLSMYDRHHSISGQGKIAGASSLRLARLAEGGENSRVCLSPQKSLDVAKDTYSTGKIADSPNPTKNIDASVNRILPDVLDGRATTSQLEPTIITPSNRPEKKRVVSRDTKRSNERAGNVNLWKKWKKCNHENWSRLRSGNSAVTTR